MSDLAGKYNPMYGRHHSKKTRRLMSQQAKRFWAKKKNHERMSKRVKAQWANPEWADRQRAILVVAWAKRKQRIDAALMGEQNVQS